MMSIVEKFLYYFDERVQVARLPYGRDKIAMYVLLPEEGTNLDSFIQTLEQEQLDSILVKMNMIELQRGIFAGALYFLAVIFDEATLMPIATVLVIGGGIWWLGRKLQSLEDGQEKLNEGQKRINDRLDNLPCDKVLKCISPK